MSGRYPPICVERYSSFFADGLICYQGGRISILFPIRRAKFKLVQAVVGLAAIGGLADFLADFYGVL